MDLEVPRSIRGGGTTFKEPNPEAWIEMKLTGVAICVPVKSIEAASHWYERCFALKEHIDPAPGIREYELLADCWLQLSEAETARSEHCLLLGVADLERERERLTSLGVEVSEIERVEGAVSFARFRDPDGNHLSLYQLHLGD